MDIDARRLAAQTAVIAGTLGLMAAPVVVFLILPQAFLLAFAGILLAVFLIGIAEIIEGYTPLSYGWSLALTGALLLALAALLSWLVLPSVFLELRQFISQLPERWNEILEMVRGTRLGSSILPEKGEGLNLSDFSDQFGEVGRRSLGVLSSLFGFVASLVIILFLGIYLAAMPGFWRWALQRFLPERARQRAEDLVDELYTTLWRWLVGRLVDMTFVGLLTGLGLFLLGMPLALSLGFIAGAFNFIPYVGPILAALPALFVALSDDFAMVLWVLGLYTFVQFLESYFITPLIQKKAVHLHPVTLLLAQIILGALYGLLGVALATPLTAVAITTAEVLAPKPTSNA